MQNKKFLFLSGLFSLILFITTCVDPAAEQLTENTQPYFVQYFQNEVFPYSSYSAVFDTHIDQNAPTTNYSGNAGMYIGPILGINRTLINFDIHGAFPSNVNIKKAYLTLRVNGWTLGELVNVQMYLMVANWNESATWNNSGIAPWSGVNITGLTLLDSKLFNETGFLITLEIPTGVIKNWINNPNTNYGILLKAQNETSGSWLQFESSDSRIINNRPLLSVYYTLP